jgi:transposase
MAQKRLSVRKIKEVLRLRFEQNLSHFKIASSLNIGESTVGAMLLRFKKLELTLSEALLFTEEELESALYNTTANNFRELPLPDWSHIHKELRRKGVTLQLLWNEYKEREPGGYQYSRFCQLYKHYANSMEYAFRNEHRGGEKLFVDYAGMTVPIINTKTSETKPAQIFIATLGASNFTYVEATWTQSSNDWINSHQNTFEFFGGAPEILVPDNLKSGVTKACRYDPDINPVYHEMARHYGSVVIPARVRKPKDKAKVEGAVLIVERWILAALRNREFFSLAELNDAIRILLDKLNHRPFQKMRGTRHSYYLELDKPRLKELPTRRFEIAEYKLATVNINYHVEVSKHNYSVPHSLVKKKVEIRFTPTVVEVLFKGKRVASHIRSYTEGGYTTLDEHMPEAHKAYVSWTPERMSRWAGQAGKNTQSVAEAIMSRVQHPQQGYRAVLGLIRLGDCYGKQRLELACEKAFTIGSPSYKSVKSLLKLGLDRQKPIQATSSLPLHPNIRGKEYYSQL